MRRNSRALATVQQEGDMTAMTSQSYIHVYQGNYSDRQAYERDRRNYSDRHSRGRNYSISRRRSMRRRKRVLAARRSMLMVILVLAVIAGVVFLSHRNISGASSGSRIKYYTSVEITQGTTLWDLAGEYMTQEYDSREDFIQEVCDINHLSSYTGRINTGDVLVIPYYADAH